MGLLEEVKSEKRITYLKALAEKVNQKYGVYVSCSRYKLADIEKLRKELLKIINGKSQSPRRRVSPERKVSRAKSPRRRVSPERKMSPNKRDNAFYKSILEISPPRRMYAEETETSIPLSGLHFQYDIEYYFRKKNPGCHIYVLELNDNIENPSSVWTVYATRLASDKGFGTRLIDECIVEGPSRQNFYVLIVAAAKETVPDVRDAVNVIEKMHSFGIVHGGLDIFTSFHKIGGVWHVADFRESWIYNGQVPRSMKIYEYATLIHSSFGKPFAKELKKYLAKNILTSAEMDTLNSLGDWTAAQVDIEFMKLPPVERRLISPGSRHERSNLKNVLYMLDFIPDQMLAQLKPGGATSRFRNYGLNARAKKVIYHHLKEKYNLLKK